MGGSSSHFSKREAQRSLKRHPVGGSVGLGISADELARQLRGSFQGLLSSQVQYAGEGYDVEVRFTDADRSRLSDLESFRVTLPSGAPVPLSEIATLDVHRGWSRITTYNGRQVVNVFGSVDSLRTNTMSILQDFRRELVPNLNEEFPGIQFAYKGEAERGAETGSSLLWAAAGRSQMQFWLRSV